MVRSEQLSAEPFASRLRILHSLSLAWLGLYLVFHAWEHWPVRGGRDAILARLDTTSNLSVELVCVIAPLVVCAVLGAWRLRRPDAEVGYPGSAFFRFGRFCGAVSLLLVIAHLGTVWRGRLTHGGHPGAAYGAMIDQAGQLSITSVYVVGSAFVCVYWALEVTAAWLRRFPSLARPALVWTVGAGVGTLLWLVFVDELSAYAAGKALL